MSLLSLFETFRYSPGPQRAAEAFETFMPYLQDVQNSFTGGYQGILTFLILLGTVIITVIGANAIIRRLGHRNKPVTVKGNPDRLFRSLLDHLELDLPDKELLMEMAKGTRLRHPTAMLLSPGLLDWSRRLWIKETPDKADSAEKTRRLQEISLKLYDHAPPVTPLEDQLATTAASS
ncbi:MAG: hypothetical protein IID32_11945 [Planctomycetes bacterium]|nr:hypothetical protein [Planctomycetota bacterium]